MRKIISILILNVLLLTLFGSFAFASETPMVYVAPYGSDTDGDGTQYNPYATIKRAVKAVSDIDGKVDVILKKGTYRITEMTTLNESDSGINFKAEEKGKVILTGAVTLSSSLFEKVTDPDILKRLPSLSRNKVFSYDLSKQGISYDKVLPVIFADNTMQTVARYPNYGFLKTNNFRVDENGNPVRNPALGTYYSDEDDTFFIDSQNLLKWNLDTAEFYGNFNNGYTWSVRKAVSLTDNNVTLEEYKYYNSDAGEYQNAYIGGYSSYYVRNIMEEIDVPGEYVIENDILYYYPIGDIDTLKVEASVFEDEAMIYIYGASDISFEGINFEKGIARSIYIKDSKSVNINNCSFKYMIASNTIELLYCYDCNITNNYAYGGTGRFIRFLSGNKNGLIPGNINVSFNRIVSFSNWSLSITGGVIYSGINSPEDHTNSIGNIVSHNIIQDCNSSTAITVTGNDNKIQYNEILNQGRATQDGGAIYMGKSASKYGSVVAHNYIHDLNLDGDYSALYSDDGFCGVKWEYNVISNVNKAMVAGLGMNVEISNNLLINVNKGLILGTRMLWSLNSKEDVFGQNGDMYKEVYNAVYNEDEATSKAYNEKYPQLKEALYRAWGEDKINATDDDLPFFAPWNTKVIGNVSIGTANAIENLPEHQYYKNSFTKELNLPYEKNVKKITDKMKRNNSVSEIEVYGADISLNAKKEGNPQYDYLNSYFKDAENQDYTLTENFKYIGITEVKTIDMSKIGIVTTDNPEIFEKKDNNIKLYETAYDNNIATISWENVENASKYEVSIFKDGAFYEKSEFFNIQEVNNYTFELDGKGEYSYTVTAVGLSREDMFEVSGSGSFVVGSAYTKNLENALFILKARIDGAENGNYSYGNFLDLMKSFYEETLAVSNTSSQTEIDNAEMAVYDILKKASENLNISDTVEITRFSPDQNSTIVYAEVKGLEANSLTTVVVLNPHTTLDNTFFDKSTNSIRYANTLKADDSGCITFFFDTSKDDIDYTGVYDVYISTQKEEIIKKSYTYGTFELSEIVIKKDDKILSSDDFFSLKGEMVSFVFDFLNRSSIVLNPCVAVGLYKNNILKDIVVSESISVGANEKIDSVIVNYTIPDRYDSDCFVSFFVWNDFDLMKPLTAVRVITEN